MMRGLWGLVWLEIKIFVREPLGVFGTVVAPAVLFVVLGRMLSGRAETSARAMTFVGSEVPVFVALFIAISAVMSLVTVVAVYREGGILKRLRATPLQPHTILTAHVIVKLIFSGLALGLMAAAGRRFYPVELDVPWLSFALALVVSLVAIVSMGFLIASLVPTARFAQPVGTVVLYPMLGISGLFVPVESLPAALQAVARVMPMTYAVSLLRGIWLGEPWSAHRLDLAALGVVFLVCTALSTRVFRWE